MKTNRRNHTKTICFSRILACLGSFGALWGRPRPLLGYLGRLDRLGSLVAASGGSPRALLGPSWASLGSSWGRLGPSWSSLGPLLGRLGAVLGRSWAVLGPSWAVLGPSWAVLGPSWAVLELSWTPVGPSGPYRRNHTKTIGFSMIFASLAPWGLPWNASWAVLKHLGGFSGPITRNTCKI